MSAWEGSSAQEAAEYRAQDHGRRVEQVQRDNPSLTRQQAELWVAKQEAEAAAKVKARCCPCRSPVRAEVVAIGNDVALCLCGCHKVKVQVPHFPPGVR